MDWTGAWEKEDLRQILAQQADSYHQLQSQAQRALRAMVAGVALLGLFLSPEVLNWIATQPVTPASNSFFGIFEYSEPGVVPVLWFGVSVFCIFAIGVYFLDAVMELLSVLSEPRMAPKFDAGDPITEVSVWKKSPAMSTMHDWIENNDEILADMKARVKVAHEFIQFMLFLFLLAVISLYHAVYELNGAFLTSATIAVGSLVLGILSRYSGYDFDFSPVTGNTVAANSKSSLLARLAGLYVLEITLLCVIWLLTSAVLVLLVTSFGLSLL